MAPFLDMHPRESLDQFHDRCVVPSQEEIKSRNKDIDDFAEFLRSEFNTPSYKVAEVRKSGSLGKGTATRGSADIDLVVILNGLSSIADLTRQRPQLLERLGDQVLGYNGWTERPRFQRKTGYSLQYIMNGHELDILPAMNIKETYKSPTKAYEEMQSSAEPKKMAQEFSASLAPWQIDFVEPKEEAVKRVIRLLKFWKYERNVRIRSYTLELLTIDVSKNAQWGSTDSLFRNVLSRLTNCDSLKVAFDLHYTSSSYTRFHGNHYVLDPANPFKDTLEGTHVNEVSRMAREMLQSL